MLIFGWYFEVHAWSRFWRWKLIVHEIVIWPKKVTLVGCTQPSGPLCLWHCLINKYMSFQSRQFHFSYNGSGQIAFFFSVILINRILQHMLNTLIINQNFQRWPKSTRSIPMQRKCKYSCTQARDLRVHLRTPYSCNQCDYSCTTASDLKRHLRLHSGEKPYKCKQCDFSCSYGNVLKQHLLTHSGEKPFHCAQCISSFTQRAHLKRHMSTHSLE